MTNSTLLPGTAASVDNGHFVSWSDVNNIKLDDGNYAVAATANIGEESDFLNGTNLGFNIPVGSTINGIIATIKGYVSPNDGSTCPLTYVKLFRGDGSAGSEDKHGSSQLPTSDGNVTFGSSSDLWSQSWSAKSTGNTDTDNVNSVNFGLSMKCTPIANDISAAANINAYKITVYYTEANSTLQGIASISGIVSLAV